MAEDTVVPFVSAIDKLLAHAQSVVDQAKIHLARNDPTYILSEVIVDHWLKMRAMSKDMEFSHQAHISEIQAAFNNVIAGCKWADEFKSLTQARHNEKIAIDKARIAAARGEIKRYKYEDCKPGEYATYDPKTSLPLPTFLNAQLIFRDLGIVGSYNVFTEKKTFLLNGKEVHIGTLRNLMWDTVFVDFPHKVLENAIDAYCMRSSFHPIIDYFDSVRHLEPRGIIDNWLTVTLGAEDNKLNREIGKKMLVAMVSRIYEPGKKFDQMIVLESNQGVGKSTLLEILCGTAYFNSGKILQMESKEQMEALKGRMIYESADLVGHGRADVDAVKAFLSATADRGRWAYAPEVKDHPRTAIIVGTTNKNNYLLDETGNRRIWPVSCGFVHTDTVYDGVPCPNEANLEWLKENRDLLFSEAIALYEQGYSIVMDRSLWGDVAALQNDRMADIAYTDNVMEVFAFTEFEGLFISEAKDIMELRIFTKDIIDQLFPSVSTNLVVGRQVKSAMANIEIGDGCKWQYKKTMKINGVVGSGYIMEVKSKNVQEVKDIMEARRKWRTRRNVNAGATNM